MLVDHGSQVFTCTGWLPYECWARLQFGSWQRSRGCLAPLLPVRGGSALAGLFFVVGARCLSAGRT